MRRVIVAVVVTALCLVGLAVAQLVLASSGGAQSLAVGASAEREEPMDPCPLPVSTPLIVSPAFTPGPGCSSVPPPGTLFGTITEHPATISVQFVNHSTTCSYPIGLGIYESHDPDIEDDTVYDYALAVIPPNSSLILTANKPACDFRAFAFYGNLIASFAGGVRYGERALDEISSVSTPVPTSTPTSTMTATSTRTSTATSTATACPVQFTDVPPGSTFYPYIRCLACRGIINGYPDGTFHPNANVTRGQLSKIVSNSAGFSDPHPAQMFQDVPVGSTFQVYIGRLASRGYINGYPCGGPGEPCGPGSLPYFRPNNNATRGQISKIDSNAAGFNDPPSGQQFEDVPAGSTYHTYTYRLVSRSIMSGYPCGGTGEPCVPPANLPYFRPNNNATRGQTSKIVGNTFFPNCQTP